MMKIKRCEDNIRCEMGACTQPATITIYFEELSAYSNVYLCARCAKKLKKLLPYGGEKSGEGEKEA